MGLDVQLENQLCHWPKFQARYGPIFKLPIFGHETWSLAEVPEVAHIGSFYPKGSKFSLFLLNGQRFPRYGGPIFKIAIFGHETWPLAKVPEVAYIFPKLPLSLKFHSDLLYGWSFPRLWQFCIFQLVTMLIFNLFLKLYLKFQILRRKFCEDCYTEYSEKVWLKKNRNCRRSSLLKSSLPYGPMLTKMIKVLKVR